MNCGKCGESNPATAKFCGQCGAPLARRCAACGADNPPHNRFCGQCGAVLAHAAAAPPAPAPPRHLAERIRQSRQSLEGERKQVTVLFADMKGSMELLADRDPEEARRLLDPVLDHMMEAVHTYEGTVNQVMGDGIMALFGAPLALEDHAVRACYAALRMQEAVRRYTERIRASHGLEIQIRVGLNSGEVVVRSIGNDLHMDYTAVGQTTHLAARMEQLATPGTIRLSGDTFALAEGFVIGKSIGPVPVKGLAEPVEVFELTGAAAARTRLQAARGRGLTRFVGRAAEMEQLKRAIEDARAGRGQIVAVVGEAGVGKSRLFYEFIKSPHMRDALVLESGSVSYGKATPFLPLADLLRSYFRIDSRDDVRGIRIKVTGGLLTLDEAFRDAIAAVLWLLDALPDGSAFLALEPAERRRQAFNAVKGILLRENETRAVVVVFEDLHWIDAETQIFLDAFVESIPGARVLLAVNYRPEYRHAWASKTYYRQLRVDPLPPESAEDLLDALLGGHASVAPLRPMLIAQTEGRPLFLEESVRMLVETGALAGERGAYRLERAPDSLRVPATVQAIIAARIDRLEPEDKRLLQAAAVVGMHVPFAVLAAIAQTGEDRLRECLARLQTAEFVYESRIFPELEYAFKHALTHEVAYGGVLQERRRALHQACLEAIERLYADRIAEHVERLAHHAVIGGAVSKAIRYLGEAGSRAVARCANREAVALFEQGLGVLRELPASAETERMELDLRIALGPALMELKSPASVEVEASYRRALELVERLGVSDKRFPVLWGLWYVQFNRGEYPQAVRAGEALLGLARSGRDSGQLLEAHHSMWPTLTGYGRPLEATRHAEQGLALYERELHAGYTALYAGHDPGACCRYHLAMLRWLTGQPDRALAHVQDAWRLAEELKHPLTTVITLWFIGWVYYQRGERERALGNFERLVSLAQPYGFVRWMNDTAVLIRLMRAEAVDSELIAQCRRDLAAVRSASWRQNFANCVIADECARLGLRDEGLSIVRSVAPETRMHFSAPEFLRIEAELLALERAASGEAEQLFRRAAELAHERGETSFELRAALGLARLQLKTRRDAPAGEALREVYRRFSEGFDTADLRSARALLQEPGAIRPGAAGSSPRPV